MLKTCSTSVNIFEYEYKSSNALSLLSGSHADRLVFQLWVDLLVFGAWYILRDWLLSLHGIHCLSVYYREPHRLIQHAAINGVEEAQDALNTVCVDRGCD